MSKLILIIPITLTLSCAMLRNLNDARKELCDLLSEDRRQHIEAEAERAGITYAEALTLFKATCLIRLQDKSVEEDALGAIGAANE